MASLLSVDALTLQNPRERRANGLAASTHYQSPSIRADHFFEAHTFIHEDMRHNHPGESFARGHNVFFVLHKLIIASSPAH